MNRHHPLDEAFRLKLEAREVDPPLHLWEAIEKKRNTKHRLINRLRLRLPMYAITFLTFSSGMFYFFLSTSIPLDSFPIPFPNEKIEAQPSDEVIPEEAALTPVDIPNFPDYSHQPIAGLTATDSNAESTTHINALISLKPELLERQEISRELTALPVLLANHVVSRNDRKEHGWTGTPRCPQFGNGRWQLYVEGVGAGLWSFRTLEAESPALEDYVGSRASSEKQLPAFSAGVRLSAISDKGWMVKGGISYTQINEKFSYLNESEARTIIHEVYDEQGNIIGTDTTIELGTRYKITYNRYRTLDVPLLLGYEFNWGKSSLYLNGGVLLNLAFRQKGAILDPVDESPVSITSSDTDAYPAFRQQLGLGWYAGMGLSYEITPDCSFIIEPHIQAYPQSITTDQYGINQQYINAGLNLGLRWAM